MLKRYFKWTKIEQYAFNVIKRIVTRDNLLTYPDFNENFKIHTDASDLKLVGGHSPERQTNRFL